MRPPYSVLARRMGPGGAGATSLGVRARERESLIVLAPLARTPSVSPRRTIGIGDGARVLFRRGAPPPENPDARGVRLPSEQSIRVDSLKTRLLKYRRYLGMVTSSKSTDARVCMCVSLPRRSAYVRRLRLARVNDALKKKKTPRNTNRAEK